MWQLSCSFDSEIMLQPFVTTALCLNDFINLMNIIACGLRRMQKVLYPRKHTTIETENSLFEAQC